MIESVYDEAACPNCGEPARVHPTKAVYYCPHCGPVIEEQYEPVEIRGRLGHVGQES